MVLIVGSSTTFWSSVRICSTLSPGHTRHWMVASARVGNAVSWTPAFSMVATQVVCRIAFIAGSFATRTAGAASSGSHDSATRSSRCAPLAFCAIAAK
ncbi:MAG TPA: hypothetical protein VNE16_12680 [Vicinamibacterales bacterium]|nr:hypothetical protein [Vicinamibacterales bacterium]